MVEWAEEIGVATEPRPCDQLCSRIPFLFPYSFVFSLSLRKHASRADNVRPSQWETSPENRRVSPTLSLSLSFNVVLLFSRLPPIARWALVFRPFHPSSVNQPARQPAKSVHFLLLHASLAASHVPSPFTFFTPLPFFSSFLFSFFSSFYPPLSFPSFLSPTIPSRCPHLPPSCT